MRIGRKSTSKYKDSDTVIEDDLSDLFMDEVEDTYELVKEVITEAGDGTLAETCWEETLGARKVQKAGRKVQKAGHEVQKASEGIAELILDMSDSVLSFGGSWTEESDKGESIEVEYNGRTYTIICSRANPSTFFDVNEREIDSVDVVKKRRKGYSSKAALFIQ